MIDPKIVSLEDFPVCDLKPDGMEYLEPEHGSIFCRVDLQIEYAKKDGVPLHLQIITPPTTRDRAMPDENPAIYPLIIYIQGSGWRRQRLGANIIRLAEIAKRGFVVAIVEYRESDLVPFPTQIKDAKTAIRFLKKNAGQFHADPNNMILWGDSSGAHTALMAGMTLNENTFTDENPDEEPLTLRSLIAFYPPTEIGTMNDYPSIVNHVDKDSPEGMLLGGVFVKDHPAMVEKASPVTYVEEEKTIPPVLIMHGDKDRIVSFQQGVVLFEKMKSCNKNVRLVRLRNTDHSGDEFFKKESMDIVEAFIKKYLV